MGKSSYLRSSFGHGVETPARRVLREFREDIAAGRGMTVVAYGDSWTYGLSTATDPWASQLGAKLQSMNPNATFVNEGVGGWDSREGLTGLAAVTAHAPDYCILNFGINDWGHTLGSNARTVPQYTADMGAIIDSLAAAGCKTILWVSGPVRSTSGSDYGCGSAVDDSAHTYKFIDYVNALKSLALDKRTPLLDIRRAFIDHHENVESICPWFWDNIHFNQQGHDFMYQVFRRALLPAPTVFVRDEFRDATGTSLSSHTPNIDREGGGWTEHAGTWQIVDDTARKVASSGAHQIASIDAGTADGVVSVRFKRTGATSSPETSRGGIAFRVVDNSNFWGVFVNGGNLQFFKNVEGAFTMVKSESIVNARDSWTLTATLEGNSISVRCEVDGGGVYTLEVTDATHAAATRHGLWAWGLTHSFDDFWVSAL